MVVPTATVTIAIARAMDGDDIDERVLHRSPWKYISINARELFGGRVTVNPSPIC
jgi:hypothetical protein